MSFSKSAKIIGQNLKALRCSAGVSQKRLGGVLGVSAQQIQKYENGANRFPIDKLFFLQNLYGVPYEAFFHNMPHTHKESGFDFSVIENLSGLSDKSLKRKIYKVIDVLCEEDAAPAISSDQ